MADDNIVRPFIRNAVVDEFCDRIDDLLDEFRDKAIARNQIVGVLEFVKFRIMAEAYDENT